MGCLKLQFRDYLEFTPPGVHSSQLEVSYLDFPEENLNREYVWTDDLSGSEQGAGGVGGLAAVIIRGRRVLFPTADPDNGNITAYLTKRGHVAARFAYSPFGRVIDSRGWMSDRLKYQFSTKPADTLTGLIHYTFREYSPELGRWLTRDPIAERGGVNLYAMVGNNAVNWWDWLGFDSFDDYYWDAQILASIPDNGKVIQESDQESKLFGSGYIYSTNEQSRIYAMKYMKGSDGCCYEYAAVRYYKAKKPYRDLRWMSYKLLMIYTPLVDNPLLYIPTTTSIVGALNATVISQANSTASSVSPGVGLVSTAANSGAFIHEAYTNPVSAATDVIVGAMQTIAEQFVEYDVSGYYEWEMKDFRHVDHKSETVFLSRTLVRQVGKVEFSLCSDGNWKFLDTTKPKGGWLYNANDLQINSNRRKGHREFNSYR